MIYQGIVKKVPFYSNTSDGTRCVPAVFRMVLKYFLPEKEYSWKHLDKLTGHIEGKGTWYFPALTKMVKMGFTIKYLSNFDYQKLFKEGPSYLNDYYDKNEADWYLKYSDVIEKISQVPSFLELVDHPLQIPSLTDISSFLDQEYLIATEIDGGMLNGEDKLSPHFVLIFRETFDAFIIHDPGLPPEENRQVSKENFQKAWDFAGADKRNIIAFKK